MNSEHGCVERAIRDLGEGFQMLPPNRICGGNIGQPFDIFRFESDIVRLRVGKMGAPINLKWSELEGVVPFVRNLGGEIEVKPVKAVVGLPTSLDGYLKQNQKVMRSTYAASLLHHAGVVEVLCTKPYRVRLREKYQ